jgi:protein-tyrosine phosphatase
MIYIDGTTNVRDIGGQTASNGRIISQGLLYRSAAFNESYTVTQNGLQQLRSLGINCEIDLRNSGEDPKIILPWLIRYVRPVTDDGEGMDSYLNGLASTQCTIKAVFKEMADKRNYPMIVHCRLGADRTGTILALLEALLGCSELQMGRDYIWTSLSLIGLRDTASDDWRSVIYYLKSFDDQNTSIQLGAWNYLQVIGMSVDELINIRKIFINDDKQPFPKLSISEQNHFKHTSKQAVSWKYLANSSKSIIPMGSGTRRMQLFDLSGRKICEFSRKSSDKAEIIKTPFLASGIHIISSFKEIVGP